ncbi:MAG: polyphenol oxidase family protein [Gemmatimonadales bacterium]|nr:polyphenol oxidase family protein [Gemmatimonadales bacterium]
MTAESTAVVQESLLPEAPPRYELTDWLRHGVVAGITGRGEATGRGFDLGLWSDAPVADTMARWRTFRRGFTGFDAVVLGNQVHGTVVDAVGAARGWVQLDGVDGWVTATPGILLTVTVADCIPVYLVAPGRGIALLHAGWRGTAGGILERGIARLVESAHASRDKIIMHCGVGICGPCYEVGREVMVGCGVDVTGAGPWHLDLRARLCASAARLGIGSVSVSRWCSAHDRASFYSHRASRGQDGRMAAYLGMPRSD